MDKFVEGMSLRGESILAFQHAYPMLNLALLAVFGLAMLGLIAWVLTVGKRSPENEG